MGNELVSVIVPYYNEEKHLERCIESIISQTYSCLEIILVNNCSDDSSKEIAEGYALKDNRIVLIECNEKGLYFARNKGLEYFNGEYVVFVDSDDCLPLKSIEILYDEAVKNKVDFVAGARFDCDEEMTWSKKREMATYSSIDKEKIHGYFLSEGMPNNQPWGKIYARKVFKNVRFESFEHYEDIATLPFILENVNSFCAINEPVYFYCIRRNSLSSTDNVKSQYLGFLARLKNMEFYEKKYPRLENAASEATLNFAFFLMGKIYKSHDYGEEWENVLSEMRRIKTSKISLGLFMSTVMHFSLLFPHPAAAMFCLYSKIKNRM